MRTQTEKLAKTTGFVLFLTLVFLLSFGASPAAFAQGQAEEFVFETKTVRYVLGANGRTISLLDKSSGKERIGDKPTPFAQVRVAGKTWPVTSLQRDGDTLLAKFGGSKVQARYRILARDTHLTVELMAVEGAQPESIELCRVQPAPLQRTGSVLVVKWDEDFTVCLMALSERVHSQIMGKDTLAAMVYPEFGMVGEKVALIAVPTSTFLDVVQEVEKTYGLPSPTIDGVWAKQSPDVDTNYLFIDVSEETADQVIDYAKMGGFGYVLIPWRSWSTSRGSYPIDRKNFPEGEESLKATIEKFHAAGLKVGMHMMTSLISKNDPLVRPTPDPRLLKDATTTLAKDIDGRSTTITARDDLAAFVDEGRQHDDGVDRGIDIQVGDEILFCNQVGVATPTSFSACQRGMYGTKAQAHPAGTPVHRLAQGAGAYLADLKTTLKDKIADRVAQVINECGFDMIYFDGGEINRANGPGWYYVGVQQNAIRDRAFWFTGLSGSGKSTLAHLVEEELHRAGIRTYAFDGDNVRHGLCGDLSFSREGRAENLRRIGEMVKLFLDAGTVCLTAFISPLAEDRHKVRQIIGEGDFFEIFVKCPLEVCEERDVKGLYKLARAGTVGNVRVVDDAVVNTQAPVKPKRALIAAVALLLGGMIGTGIVLVRAMLNRGIENPDDIEKLGLPVYATVPLSETQQAMAKKKRSRKDPTAGLLAIENPADLAIESLRSLRTSLHFGMMDARNNILMISGPSPGVGKTFVSVNLAAVMAMANQRVLLVDADLRRGFSHDVFKVSNQKGLSDILAGKASVEEATEHSGVEGLDFISRGTVPPNPSELLMSKRFDEFLKQASENYDLVIVDTPPILAVTDPAIVGKHAGTTMLVARFGANPAKELELTKRRFEQNGIEVKGVIFNAVEKKASNYGYGGYGYYNYAYKSAK